MSALQVSMDVERVDFVKLGSSQNEDGRILYVRSSADGRWQEQQLNP